MMKMRLRGQLGGEDSWYRVVQKAPSLDQERERERRYPSLDSAKGHYGVDDGGPLGWQALGFWLPAD